MNKKQIIFTVSTVCSIIIIFAITIGVIIHKNNSVVSASTNIEDPVSEIAEAEPEPVPTVMPTAEPEPEPTAEPTPEPINLEADLPEEPESENENNSDTENYLSSEAPIILEENTQVNNTTVAEETTQAPVTNNNTVYEERPGDIPTDVDGMVIRDGDYVFTSEEAKEALKAKIAAEMQATIDEYHLNGTEAETAAVIDANGSIGSEGVTLY